MRIITSSCHTFEYTVTTPSPCAVGLSTTEIGVAHRFSDCLVVTIEVEHGDHVLSNAAVKVIRRVMTQTGAAGIVVDGYLKPPTGSRRTRLGSDLLLELADSLDLLAEITSRLAGEYERIHVMPFGWYRNAEAELTSGACGRRSIHLGGDHVSAAGRVVAALDVATSQRFREKPVPSAASMGA
ncbi:threonyl-tRNA synthetase editing domain-containing protein [Nocardia sp. NPDC046763]|uniref:threonyl-tRNA synthetase editing domain-containing protein n=1 Tax=Nocardia sp. NPDC046763 TaxID=3155256 RepID=UPI0033E5B538